MPPGGERTAQHVRSRIEAMNKVEARIAQNMTLHDACDGICSVRTYDSWRVRHKDFAERVDRVRGMVAGQAEAIEFRTFRSVYFDRDTPAHHELMIEAIESAPVDSISMVLAPPEAAKTSVLVDYICWKLALDPNFRVALVCESLTLSRKILNQIARRMTDEVTFGPFIHRYGPFKSPERDAAKPWNADAITVLRASHDEKEPSIEARGATGQIYGARYDLLILDDIQSTSNLGETDRLVRDFRQTMLSRVSNDQGRTVIIGSRIDKGDFYEALLTEEDGELVDRFVKIPAITAAGESYWPSYWPMDRLRRRQKKVGESAWLRAYMQAPMAVGSGTFLEEHLLACQNRGAHLGHVKGDEVICAVDPALVGPSAFVALGIERDRAHLIDIDAYVGLSRTEEILNRMFEYTIRYRPSTWVVEIAAFQGALAEDNRLWEMARTYNFDVVRHTTNKSKADPILGVGSMASMFSLGEVSVPYADVESQHKVDKLYKELLDWRPNVLGKFLTQDRVMALWFAWRVWAQRRRVWDVPDFKEWRPSFMSQSTLDVRVLA